MTQALAKTAAASIARDDSAYFSRTQIDTIKSVLCRGITDPELSLFSEVCRKTGLDPFAKQIYPIKRSQWDAEARQNVEKLTIQTGIDGYRLIAERTGKYQGQAPFQWCGEDGQWVDVWTRKEPPVAAKATIFREGFVQPLVRIARWGAYVQTKRDGEPVKMWAQSGPEQLAKCAEALALRTAFPQELSGLYMTDEMAQAENELPVRASVVSRAPANALPTESKPASAPPPAAEQRDKTPEESARIGAPTNTAAARFQWKASDEWNGKTLIEAPTETLIEYSDYLGAVIHQNKGTKAAKLAGARLTEAETEIAARMDAEQKLAKQYVAKIDVAAGLQDIVDKAHPPEDDAAGSWLDPEAT